MVAQEKLCNLLTQDSQMYHKNVYMCSYNADFFLIVVSTIVQKKISKTIHTYTVN